MIIPSIVTGNAGRKKKKKKIDSKRRTDNTVYKIIE
jgi:hypothetical protein